MSRAAASPMVPHSAVTNALRVMSERFLMMLLERKPERGEKYDRFGFFGLKLYGLSA